MALPKDSTNLKARYDDLVSTLRELETEVKFTLEKALKTSGIPIHGFQHRIKAFESVREKMQDRPNFLLQNLNDLVGFRIVCLFLSDIPLIRDIVATHFKILGEDDKISKTPPHDFRYLSLHLTCAIKDANAGPRYENIKNFPFEIQVRTISMDAWASLSHYLDYKAEQDIPESLRRDFYGISGLFYVADTHFELFFKAKNAEQKRVETSIMKGAAEDAPLNVDSLSVLLRQLYPMRGERDTARDSSSLLREVQKLGYKTVGGLAQDLMRGEKAFLAYEKKYPPYGKASKEFTGIGAARITLNILHPQRRLQPGRSFKEFEKLVKT